MTSCWTVQMLLDKSGSSMSPHKHSNLSENLGFRNKIKNQFFEYAFQHFSHLFSKVPGCSGLQPHPDHVPAGLVATYPAQCQWHRGERWLAAMSSRDVCIGYYPRYRSTSNNMYVCIYLIMLCNLQLTT